MIKVLPPETAAPSPTASAAIQLAAQLQHAHIVPLLSTGESAGVPFYMMPLVEGDAAPASHASASCRCAMP